MVTLAQNDPISPDARALIETRVHHADGLRQLATLLPSDDSELADWIKTAAVTMDEGTAERLLFAAALGERSLPASLLPPLMFFNTSFMPLGWIAWRMTGNVAEELLHGFEHAVMNDQDEAGLLLVAAAWWTEQRPDEEVPRQLLRLALRLWENRPEELVRYLLMDIGLITGDPALLRRSEKAGACLRPTVTREKRRKQALAFLHLPFDRFLHQRPNHDYCDGRPMRRAVERIGNNEKCRCGSGKKYKKCCQKQDRERLRDSSSIAGVTRHEMFEVSGEARTKEWLTALRPADLASVELEELPTELHADYIAMLLASNQYDEAMGVFRALRVTKELRGAWLLMLNLLSGAWRPDLARELYELFDDVEGELGLKPTPRLRFLMVGDNPAAAMQELEDSAAELLKSGDVKLLRELILTVLDSPYRALGILLARSLLPIMEGNGVAPLFENILDARAKLGLPPEDEFADWVDEHALHKARKHDNAATQEALDKLEANKEALRRAQEERARSERELARLRRSQRAETAVTATVSRPPPDSERERELEGKVEKLSGLVTERNEERLTLRRKLQRANEENDALRESATSASQKGDYDDDEGKDLQFEGNQPVRLLEFAKGFRERLASCPRHIGRATMNRLGRLASGEPGAFERVKQLRGYPDVLRARVSDKYRLLFYLLPNSVRVVDLIRRADLDQRIERFKVAGLPPVG